uniref:Glutaredoxin domain-containing protein n=1 Tax=Oryza punctata TaxID=4537 RepID=A0A0E0KGV8_ORYPU
MRGLRSRILRTLQSFPNAANAQSGLLLPAPDAAPSPPCRSGEEPVVSDGGGDDKENVSPEVAPRKAKKMRVSLGDAGAAEAEAACYRRPDPATATLFDPDLLAAFRGAVDAYARALQEAKRRDEDDDDDFFLLEEEEEGCGVAGGVGFGVDEDPLEGFENRCPPGGERAVVLYTTSLRGVRKTFEDCATVRRLLEGLRVAFLERDVSMHAPYRDELRALLRGLDAAAAVPPRLFVDGRYLGGANEVVTLHEQARLRPVLRRAPRRGAGDAACAVCGGAWFVVCGACSGSHRLYDPAVAGAAGANGGRVPCTGCNENGLVPCPLCS